MGEDARAYPNLVEFLALTKYTDGTRRITGSVNLFVEDGRLKVCFNDRDVCQVAFRVMDALDTLLAGLEAALEDPDLDWRKSRENGGYKRK
jgi:hypothetical protein